MNKISYFFSFSNSHLLKAINKVFHSKSTLESPPLWQVFLNSQKTIQKDLKQPITNFKLLKEKIEYLNNLKNRETQSYQKFCLSTHTRPFIYAQKLFYSLPLKIRNILTRIYPFSLINQQINNAALNKHYFYPYDQFINSCIDSLKVRQDYLKSLKPFIKANHKIQNLLQTEIPQIEKFKQLKDQLLELNSLIKNLNSACDKHLFLKEAGLSSHLISFLITDEKIGLSPFLLLFHQYHADGDLSHFEDLLQGLTDNDSIGTLLKGFENPLQFDCDIRQCVQLVHKNVRVRPSILESFTGPVNITFNRLVILQELQKQMNEHPGFRPTILKISLSAEYSLSEEFIEALKNLAEVIPYIRLEAICYLNLKNVSENSLKVFFELFSKIDLITGKNVKIQFPPHAANWSEKEIKRLFVFWPATDLNLQGLPTDSLLTFLENSPRIHSLEFDQHDLTNDHFLHFHQKGLLKNLKNLNLVNCKALSTDILPTLIQLPELVSLQCPNLQQGKTELPKLKNPFEIKFFYTLSQNCDRTCLLYTGPLEWAFIFQIPLARRGEKNIFEPSHTLLDPQSVQFWLYRQDYMHLEPQLSIRTIYADNNAALNDQNLPLFISKFPKVQTISLHNCPHITTQGVIKMLSLVPDLKKLDLSSCPGINPHLFSNEFQNGFISLDEIDVSNTGIDEKHISRLPEVLKNKVKWQRQCLNISNADLISAGSLKEALKAYFPLNSLIRLDLSGCQALSLNDFRELLNCLNLEIENPARLNITELILTGTKCQFPWFDRPSELLGNLKIVVIENQKIRSLRQKYPEIIFRDVLTPFVETLNIDQELSNCFILQHSNDPNERIELSKKYLRSRAAVELFGDECKNQASVTQELSIRLKSIEQEEFKDCDLTFSDTRGSLSTFSFFKNQLYCQSLSMQREYRPGGLFSKSKAVIENQNATSRAGKLLTDLLQGKPLNSNVAWKTLFETSELTNPHNLNIPALYEKLTDYLHERYKYLPAEMIEQGKGFNILKGAMRLENNQGLALLERRFCQLLIENLHLHFHFSEWAHNLPYLSICFELASYLKTIEFQLSEINHAEIPMILIEENVRDRFYALVAQKDIPTILREMGQLSLFEQKVLLDLLLIKIKENLQNN